MGTFPKWRLSLRAEPRLWGAVVLDHPKNPAALRGKAFAMESLLNSPNEYFARVVDETGTPIRFQERDAWLVWEGTRATRAFWCARRRWLMKRLETGTLDVVCGDEWRQRDEGRALWFVMAPASVGLLLTLVFGFVLPFIRGPQASRTPLDWLILCGFCGMTLAIPAVCVWLVSQGRHRSCRLYRLTATTITPLDGAHRDHELTLASCTGHDKLGMRLARLRFGDRVLVIDPPPIPVADLLGRQEAQRRENKRVYRRLAVYGVIGVALYVAAVVFTQPITGVPVWRPLSVMAAGVPLAVLFALYGERWLKRAFASIERRSRHRKNRHAAAAGRRLG